MQIRRIVTGILLLCASRGVLNAQTHKDSAIVTIRQYFQRISNDKSLRVVRMDEGEFSEETTDNGGELTGYFKGDTLSKMILEIGLSYTLMRWEYYFYKKHIIFIYETENDYPQDSTTGGLNNSKVVLAFEGRYYYENDKLISTLFKGKKRMDENSAASYVGALPGMDEVRSYIRQLTKKAK